MVLEEKKRKRKKTLEGLGETGKQEDLEERKRNLQCNGCIVTRK